jgi:hypothetical protein
MTPKVFAPKWDDIEAKGAVIKHRRGRPYNALAGFWRNQEMAEYAEQAVIFPGGRGTNDMFNRARKEKLIVHDRRAFKCQMEP